jgi:hypothetical protein
MRKPKAPGPGREEAAFWNAIALGDFVSLSDFQSLADGGGPGLDCRVRAIRDIALGDPDTGRSLARYRLHELEVVGKAPIHFLVLSAGEDFELRTYFVPEGLPPGSRDQLIDAGRTWLFLPPPDPEDFVSSELEFAPFPDLPALPEAGGPVKRVWAASGFGRPVFGSYPLAGEEVPVILAEYETEEEGAQSPLLLVLEERWMRRDGSALPEGGLVTMMLGTRVDPGSVDLFPA